jgi:methionyl aminopeptidase
MSITIKTAEDVAGMRVAGRLASEVLDMLTAHVQPGITTDQLDQLAHRHIVEVQGAVPAPLNYAPPGYTPYPKSICTSINHQVCHGIPNDRPLKNGDIVNIDVTVIKDGWHGDTSRMFIVGEGSIAAKRLCALTYEAMWRGIERVKPGIRLGDIGHAIQTFTERQGFSVVREFCGHGIGRKFHEEPQVLHYGRPGTLEELVPGMRRLDHRHQGPVPLGAVGAHRAGHRDRLRGADRLRRQPAAARDGRLNAARRWLRCSRPPRRCRRCARASATARSR